MNAFNLKNVVRGGLVPALVLFALSAFAVSKGSLQLQHPTNVGGKQLATGNYTVQWDGTGDGGSSSLAEIRFRGKNFALRVAGEGGSSSSGASAQ